MDLRAFMTTNAPTVDDRLTRQMDETRTPLAKFTTGGSTLDIATPRQQREAQRIKEEIQPVINAVTDPVYAFTPGVDQRRQDARRRILEKVAAVATDPMAATFAGVGAKMADKAALARSLEMKAAGVADKEIWQQTGWTHGFPDGKPRFEIDDSAANIRNGTLDNNRGIVAEALDHEPMYNNYPDIASMNIYSTPEGSAYSGGTIKVAGLTDGTGALNTASGTKSLALHEAQHAIQDQEGLARGGSMGEFVDYSSTISGAGLKEFVDRLDILAEVPFLDDLSKMTDIKEKMAYAQRYPELYATAGEFFKKYGHFPTRSEVKSKSNQLWAEAESASPREQYRRLAGEVEARLTQRRMNLNAEQRRQRYPVDDMDIPVKDQIVRFGGGRAESAGKDPDSYKGSHRPVTVEGGAATLDDLTPAFGDDIYGPQAAQYYGTGDAALDRQTLSVLKSVKGKPDAEITVYRAVPADAEASALNTGDWVTVNRKYAEMHGEGTLEGKYKIIAQKVKAADLTTNADSFHEQGYYPRKGE